MRQRRQHETTQRALPGLATFLALALTVPAPLTANETMDELESEANAISSQLADQLGEALREALQSGGPEEAVTVCRDLAPQLKAELSRNTGWRVTRVGTRVRNPLLGRPDAWEQTVLQDFQHRLEDGEPMAELRHAERVAEPDGAVFRFMRGIGTQEACLACHGERQQRHEDTFKVLGELYPHDQAVDYKPGDLRGAFSLSRPLE